MWMKDGCQSTSKNINEKCGGKTWMMMELKAKETRLFWTGMGSQRGEMKAGGTMKVCYDG